MKNTSFRMGDVVAAKEATNTTTVAQPWASAQPYLLQGLQSAANLAAQGPQKYTPWSQVANLDPMQLAAMRGTRNYVNAPGTQGFMNTAANGVQGLISGALNPLQQMAMQGGGQALGYLTNNNMYDPATATNQMMYGNNQNPYLKNNVDSALRQLSNQFTTQTLPGMRREAIGNNSYGSSRNEMAEGQAGGDLARQMYQTASGLYGQDYNTQQQNAFNALGTAANQQYNQANLTNQLFNAGNQQNLNAQQIGLQNYQNALNMPLQMLQARGQIGQQQQNQNQAAINDAANRWNFNQNSNWSTIQQLASMVNGQAPYGSSTSGQSYTQKPVPPTNTAGLVTSGLLSGAGLAASLYK